MHLTLLGTGGRLSRAIVARAHVAPPFGAPVTLSDATAPATGRAEPLRVAVAAEPEGSPVATVLVHPDAQTLRDEATRATTPVVGAGLVGGIADLLAALAARDLTGVVDVQTCYAFPDRRSALGAATPGMAADLATRFAAPVHLRRDGRWQVEALGDDRRLAWFPRPLGPRHAIAVGAPDPVLVAARHPAATRLGAHVGATSLTAELLQFAGARDPRGPVGRRIRTAIANRGVGDEERRAQARWAIVAEVLDDDGELVRTWASGRDAVAVTAWQVVRTALLVARAHEGRRASEDGRDGDVLARPPAGTPVGPAWLEPDPSAALDEAADVTGLAFGRITSELLAARTRGRPGR